MHRGLHPAVLHSLLLYGYATGVIPKGLVTSSIFIVLFSDQTDTLLQLFDQHLGVL